jgi:hypothetical protein
MIAACVVVFGGSSADRARSICPVVERRCRKSTVRFIEVDITASLGYDRPATTTGFVRFAQHCWPGFFEVQQRERHSQSMKECL